MKHEGHLACALVFLVLLFGCGGGTSEEHHAPDHAHGAVEMAVDSTRWQANLETTEGIRGMRALVEGYPANGMSSGPLRDSLDARMALIFERCTMKGEAHEALHHYLLPLQGLIHRIPEGASSAQLDSLRHHLAHFDEVFY